MARRRTKTRTLFPYDEDDEVDSEFAEIYLRMVAERQNQNAPVTPPRQPAAPLSIRPSLILTSTDTPQGLIIEGEARLASFRKKAARANRWLTGLPKAFDLLSGYPNTRGILEAAHAAPRKAGYANWELNRSVEFATGLDPGSLHYDTVWNGFLVLILIHRLYDEGFLFILPEFAVFDVMLVIAKKVHGELEDFSRRLEAAHNVPGFNAERWIEEELVLRLRIRERWKDFDANHAKNGTMYHVYATSAAANDEEVRKTPIPQLQSANGGRDFIDYPWHGLLPFRCHIHPRFFIIDSFFKDMQLFTPEGMQIEQNTEIGQKIYAIRFYWTEPAPQFFQDDAVNTLQDRYRQMQVKLRDIKRPSKPLPIHMPATPIRQSFQADVASGSTNMMTHGDDDSDDDSDVTATGNMDTTDGEYTDDGDDGEYEDGSEAMDEDEYEETAEDMDEEGDAGDADVDVVDRRTQLSSPDGLDILI